jgi:acyl-homoserine lactone acylase PvdQ
MDIEQITNAKVKLEAKAKKWLGYLDSVPDAETKQKEMTRLLMETFLEGANNYYATTPPANAPVKPRRPTKPTRAT